MLEKQKATATSYANLPENAKFRIRYAHELIDIDSWLKAVKHHGNLVVNGDYAINQHGSVVMFTDNYPVWQLRLNPPALSVYLA